MIEKEYRHKLSNEINIEEFCLRLSLSSIKLEMFLKNKESFLNLFPEAFIEILEKVYSKKYIFITDNFILIEEKIIWRDEKENVKALSNKYSQITFLTNYYLSNKESFLSHLKEINIDNKWFNLFKYLVIKYDEKMNNLTIDEIIEKVKSKPYFTWYFLRAIYNNPYNSNDN
jgi:hypothetical protein